MARRTSPDPDGDDSYFELLDDPVRPAPVDRVALAESELRRLGLDEARVRSDGDRASVLLPEPPSVALGAVVVGVVRSAGFTSVALVRTWDEAP